MNRFLVLGAGFVAEPVLEYLLRKDSNQVTVASHIFSEAQLLADKFSQATPIQINVMDAEELQGVIREHDIVVSLVPAPLHPAIAKACIAEKRHMITASYESDEMRELASAAKDAGITILNEIGLDPGIDHLSAMKIIDDAHRKGEKVRSFISWCGGLPAPESNDNPLGYKFSWAPKGVLMALLNEATFLRNNAVETVESSDLLGWSKKLSIAGMELEGYPNRESTSYQKSYNIPESKTILRGTLRYSGFSEIIQGAKSLGLLDTEAASLSKVESISTWGQYICALNGVAAVQELELEPIAREGLEWLGCFSDTPVNCSSNGVQFAPIDVFCELLTEKLAYRSGERDMVVLQHKFEMEKTDGTNYFLQSTLVAYGDPMSDDASATSYTAMSKTVGYPVAIASQLLAESQITTKGVLIPVSEDIYLPILERLEQENIICEEVEVTHANFLSEVAQ